MRVLTFAAAALLGTGLAQAADYPVLRGSTVDTPPAPADYFGGSEGFNWSGIYFGGFAGQSQTKYLTDQGVRDLALFSLNNTTIVNSFSATQSVNLRSREDSGVTFGGFAGYNYQIGDVVVGLEADYTKVDQGTVAGSAEARRIGNEYVALVSTQNATLNDFMSLRARFGYTYGRLMPYFTAGGAAGRFDTNVSVTTDWGQTNANGVPVGSYIGWPRTVGGPKKDVWGYGVTIGGGLEAGLTENLFVRGEYLFTRFNNVEGITVNHNVARVAAAVKF